MIDNETNHHKKPKDTTRDQRTPQETKRHRIMYFYFLNLKWNTSLGYPVEKYVHFIKIPSSILEEKCYYNVFKEYLYSKIEAAIYYTLEKCIIKRRYTILRKHELEIQFLVETTFLDFDMEWVKSKTTKNAILLKDFKTEIL